MLPIAAMAAGKVGGQAGSIAKDLALKALPAAAAMGGGGYLAYQATSAVDRMLPAGPEQAKERRDATVGAFTPLPAFAAGVAGIGAAVGIARQEVTRPFEAGGKLINRETGELVKLDHVGPRGWTLGPRLLRGASLGAIGGAAIAAGLAVPVVAMGAGLLQKGLDAGFRKAAPGLADAVDGAVDALGGVTDGIGNAVDGVGDAVRRLNEGEDPTVVKVEGSYDRPPGTPFDPAKELGLDKPLSSTIEDRDDRRDAVADELIKRFEEAGVEATQVDP